MPSPSRRPAVPARGPDLAGRHADTERRSTGRTRLPAGGKPPRPSQISQLAELLSTAKRPIAILGGTRWSAEAVAGFQSFAERWQLPVGCSFRRQMLFDHLHPNYAGDVGIGINPVAGRRNPGCRPSSSSAAVLGNAFLRLHADRRPLPPGRPWVHVHPDPGELGRSTVRTSQLPRAPRDFVAALSSLTLRRAHWSGPHRGNACGLPQMVDAPEKGPGDVQMGPIVNWLEANTGPEDDLHQTVQATTPPGSIGSTVSGVTGRRLLPLPVRWVTACAAAVAASSCIANPRWSALPGTAVSSCTARSSRPPSATNSHHRARRQQRYLRYHPHASERDYPGRVSATDLTNRISQRCPRLCGTRNGGEDGRICRRPSCGRVRAASRHHRIKLDPEAITPTPDAERIRTGECFWWPRLRRPPHPEYARLLIDCGGARRSRHSRASVAGIRPMRPTMLLTASAVTPHRADRDMGDLQPEFLGTRRDGVEGRADRGLESGR